MDRKPIFDAVRSLLKRSFTRAEVEALDQAIDRAVGQEGSAAPEAAATPAGLCLGYHGVGLIKQFEGCSRRRHDGRIEAYPDPGTGGEPWTIGWGATHMYGRPVRPGDIISQAEADALLEEHLASYAAQVAEALGEAPVTPEQFDALVSFHYNTGAIGRATLTKKHCAGDFEGAAREFARWNRAGGKVMKGLARRRAAEAELYRRGC
jgi:GH24 family phage-related lysozyme (muramidase)